MANLYTFEFKKEEFNCGGTIQSIDWNTNIAVVDITDDSKSFWKENFNSEGKGELVSVSNLITETEKVSSYSYSELENMLKEAYS